MIARTYGWTVAVFALVAVLLLGCTATNVPLQERNIPVSDQLSLLTMRASEVSCPGCVWAVSTAIEAVPGVIAVDGNIKTKKIFVIYDRTLVASDAIVSHPIFDNYGRELVSDEPYFP